MNFIKLKKLKKMIDRKSSYYKTDKYTYNFQNFRTISTFDRDVYKGKITKKRSW